MTPKELLLKVSGEAFTDQRGRTGKIQLEPGLAKEGIAEFERKLGVSSLPAEIRELVEFSRGFRLPEGKIGGPPIESFEFAKGMDLKVDFTAVSKAGYDFGAGEIPCGIVLCQDNCGNSWVVDVNVKTGEWSPVFYWCHDPYVLICQARTLADFLAELFKLYRGQESLLRSIHQEGVFKIREPLPRKASELRGTADPHLKEFVETLPDEFSVFDLRDRVVGSGCDWLKYGFFGDVKRHPSELIFALGGEKRKGFLAGLFGSKPVPGSGGKD